MIEGSEVLHVYDLNGSPLAELDLVAAGESVQVTVDDKGKLAFVPVVGASDRVVAALVRDEDGWMLVAVTPEVPVVSGASESDSQHLIAGLPCSIDKYVFRLERSEGEAGMMLVWRYAGSPYSVDSIQNGKNSVGVDREFKHPKVNGMLPDRSLFDFYPTADGIDVSTSGDSADRLSVPMKTLFSVGEFEGMLMTAGDAAAAVKSSNPFAWPSRQLRQLLKRVAIAIVALFALVIGIRMLTARYERLNCEPHGAVAVQLDRTPAAAIRDDDVVYELAFMRSLKSVLVAEPNAVTLDLIQRGEQLSANSPSIAAKVKFLKDVHAIQETIKTGRWEDFRKVFAKIDRKLFVAMDADVFMDDAGEVAEFVTHELPKRLVEVSRPGHGAEMQSMRGDIDRIFSDLSDNIFMRGAVFQREYDNMKLWIETVDHFVQKRDAVLAALDAQPITLNRGQLASLTTACYQIDYLRDMKIADESLVDPACKIGSETLKDIVVRTLKYVNDTAKSDDSSVLILLEPLADLADKLGTYAQQPNEWRVRARRARKALDARERALYSAYRRKAGHDDSAGEVLEQILELGNTDSSFHAWALKEKQRLESSSKQEVVK